MAITNQVEDPCSGLLPGTFFTGGGGLIVKEDIKEVHFFSPKS